MIIIEGGGIVGFINSFMSLVILYLSGFIKAIIPYLD